jgi:hypothetical protein
MIVQPAKAAASSSWGHPRTAGTRRSIDTEASTTVDAASRASPLAFGRDLGMARRRKGRHAHATDTVVNGRGRSYASPARSARSRRRRGPRRGRCAHHDDIQVVREGPGLSGVTRGPRATDERPLDAGDPAERAAQHRREHRRSPCHPHLTSRGHDTKHRPANDSHRPADVQDRRDARLARGAPSTSTADEPESPRIRIAEDDLYRRDRRICTADGWSTCGAGCATSSRPVGASPRLRTVWRSASSRSTRSAARTVSIVARSPT